MKKNYLLNSVVALLFSFTPALLNAQSAIIYNTTHAATNGAEINSTANGLATKMGDAIVLAGTNRYVTSVSMELFNLASLTPFTLTLSVYTDCSSGATGCGTGTGVLVPNSTSTINVTPTTLGTIYTVNFTGLNINLTGETDNSVVVMLNASRNDVFWTLNETPVVGSIPAGEAAASVVVRCGSTVAANNGCSRTFTSAINNFSMLINASPTLMVDGFNFAEAITLYPNPAKNTLTISDASNSANASIEITDISGRIVKSLNAGFSNELVINVSELTAGNYILKLKSENGTAVKKFIKM